MGEHRYNRVAIANSGPKQMVPVMDLGEEAALLGVKLQPVIDTVTQELVVRIDMIGGHASPILGAFAPKQVPIGELTRLPLAMVRKVLKGAAPPAVEPPVTPGEAASEESPTSDEAPAGGPPLIIEATR